jgi:hypothetical protein
LNISERVVWVSDKHGIQFGVVRFVGKLGTREKKTMMAGVDFVSLLSFN